MIVFLPKKQTIYDALESGYAFCSIKQMLEDIVEKYHHAFDINDIYISYHGFDERIGCDVFFVCVSKFFEEDFFRAYNSPQAIGFCVFYDEEKQPKEYPERKSSKKQSKIF